MKSKNPILATQLLQGGSAERMVGRNGEINAYDKRDLLNQQQNFLAANKRDSISMHQRALQASVQGNMLSIDSKTDRELLESAFNDREAHRVLGEKIADALTITANRQGFMRKYTAKVDTQQGSNVRFSLSKKNVTAVWSTSPTKVESQIVRDNYFYPPELQIVARPFVPQNELNVAAGDVVQRKFVEATEATMVAEDRLWYNQVQATIGVDNNMTIISGQLTPYSLTTVSSQVTQWGLKAAHVLMASDLWNDIIGNADFYQAIDPVARHELLLTGELGTIYGMTVTSDAFRHAEHKVLGRGEFYVISDALNHGAYSDRGGIVSIPTDISQEQVPGRGFVMHESLSVCIANSRSVAKGLRI
jgi:hypothetical protein